MESDNECSKAPPSSPSNVDNSVHQSIADVNTVLAAEEQQARQEENSTNHADIHVASPAPVVTPNDVETPTNDSEERGNREAAAASQHQHHSAAEEDEPMPDSVSPESNKPSDEPMSDSASNHPAQEEGGSGGGGALPPHHPPSSVSSSSSHAVAAASEQEGNHNNNNQDSTNTIELNTNEINRTESGPPSARKQQSRDIVPVVLTLRLRAGVAQMQGRRKEMEDAHQIANSMRDICPTETEETSTDLNGESFLGVYDGHAGSGAAEYAGRKLHRHFMEHPEFKTNTREALKEAFALTEKEICTNFSSSGDGTTAVVAYIRENQLIVGHVGDSEAVLCRDGKAIALTEPHNAKANAKERQRIRDAGGVLVAGDTRVGHPALNPMLFSIAVTRAMGDVLLKAPEYTNGKPSGLIAEPEILQMDLTEQDEFIVLACDGVWDVLSHQQCSDFVRAKLQEGADPREASLALVEHAYGLGSNDNITCVVCKFN